MRELCSPVFDMLSPETCQATFAHSLALWTSTGPAQRSPSYRWGGANFLEPPCCSPRSANGLGLDLAFDPPHNQISRSSACGDVRPVLT